VRGGSGGSRSCKHRAEIFWNILEHSGCRPAGTAKCTTARNDSHRLGEHGQERSRACCRSRLRLGRRRADRRQWQAGALHGVAATRRTVTRRRRPGFKFGRRRPARAARTRRAFKLAAQAPGPGRSPGRQRGVGSERAMADSERTGRFGRPSARHGTLRPSHRVTGRVPDLQVASACAPRRAALVRVTVTAWGMRLGPRTRTSPPGRRRRGLRTSSAPTRIQVCPAPATVAVRLARSESLGLPRRRTQPEPQ
jgi:hypothetical protein